MYCCLCICVLVFLGLWVVLLVCVVIFCVLLRKCFMNRCRYACIFVAGRVFLCSKKKKTQLQTITQIITRIKHVHNTQLQKQHAHTRATHSASPRPNTRHLLWSCRIFPHPTQLTFTILAPYPTPSPSITLSPVSGQRRLRCPRGRPCTS